MSNHDNNNNNNNEPILSERCKALLEELRTIDRVSDYTTGFVEEIEETTLMRKIIQNRSRGWIIRQLHMQ
jgi:hypothetical protein